MVKLVLCTITSCVARPKPLFSSYRARTVCEDWIFFFSADTERTVKRHSLNWTKLYWIFIADYTIKYVLVLPSLLKICSANRAFCTCPVWQYVYMKSIKLSWLSTVVITLKCAGVCNVQVLVKGNHIVKSCMTTRNHHFFN